MPRAPVPALVPADEGLLTLPEVAALLRTTPRQVWNMIHRGQLPIARKWAGLGWRVPRATFMRWLEDESRRLRAVR